MWLIYSVYFTLIFSQLKVFYFTPLYKTFCLTAKISNL